MKSQPGCRSWGRRAHSLDSLEDGNRERGREFGKLRLTQTKCFFSRIFAIFITALMKHVFILETWVSQTRILNFQSHAAHEAIRLRRHYDVSFPRSFKKKKKVWTSETCHYCTAIPTSAWTFPVIPWNNQNPRVLLMSSLALPDGWTLYSSYCSLQFL